MAGAAIVGGSGDVGWMGLQGRQCWRKGEKGMLAEPAVGYESIMPYGAVFVSPGLLSYVCISSCFDFLVFTTWLGPGDQVTRCLWPSLMLLHCGRVSHRGGEAVRSCWRSGPTQRSTKIMAHTACAQAHHPVRSPCVCYCVSLLSNVPGWNLHLPSALLNAYNMYWRLGTMSPPMTPTSRPSPTASPLWTRGTSCAAASTAAAGGWWESVPDGAEH